MLIGVNLNLLHLKNQGVKTMLVANFALSYVPSYQSANLRLLSCCLNFCQELMMIYRKSMK